MTDPDTLSAREAGLVGCLACTRVHAQGTPFCSRCGARLHSRRPESLQKVWAWLIAGLVAYIPANLYPMLRTATLTEEHASTILSGVAELVQHREYGVALIVFVASVLIPIGKFGAIAFLALSIRYRWTWSLHQKHRLHAVVEFIGRWSMIDVFVVAILSALVQLGSVATINPGIAAVSFSLSVAFTMLSAQAFDPRMIWDADARPGLPA